jgi:hypothetical protein
MAIHSSGPGHQANLSPRRRALVRRWLRPQLSLRAFLLLGTAFAVGFPMWNVWPFTEHQVEPSGVAGYAIPRGRERTTQKKRVIGGEPVKHGTEVVRIFKRSQRRIEVETTATYRDGVLHGEYREQIGGVTTVSGQYKNGVLDGLWTRTNDVGTYRLNWNDGKLHGAGHFARVDGTREDYQFFHGVLILRDGSDVSSPLLDHMTAGTIDSVKCAGALQQPTRFEVANTPLRDCVEYLRDLHEISIQIDRSVFQQTGDYLSHRITANLTGLNLATVLVEVCDDSGLVCDFRYGCPWITTKDNAEKWVERTGVSKFVPRDGSALRREWDSVVSITAIQEPLAAVIQNLCRQLSVPCDTTAIEPTDASNARFPVVINEGRLPLRHLLPVLLTQTDSCCELSGHTLVIKPQGVEFE